LISVKEENIEITEMQESEEHSLKTRNACLKVNYIPILTYEAET
jgi:hypothetical protein